MYGSSCVLIRVGSSLCSDGIELSTIGKAGIYVAVLENNGGVTKYEINRAIDVTFTIKLSQRMRVQRVLVPFKAATVEGGQVGSVSHRNCLVLAWPRRVAECYVNR